VGLYDSGVNYIDQGNFIQAIADFIKVIELNPTNPAGYHNRAVCFYQLKE